MEFKERLTATRRMRGLNQESLAERVGVSRQAVSKWETGDAMPDCAKLMMLADALEVSMDYLCGREETQCCAPEQGCGSAAVRKKTSFLRVVITALLALVLLGGGFLAGWLVAAQTHEVAQLPMPDGITVDGFGIDNLGDDGLAVHFIPSIANKGYTYQVSFLGWDGTERIFDVDYGGGICYCKTDLASGMDYTVTAIISNGKERRLIPLAFDLTFSDHGASWTPVS